VSRVIPTGVRWPILLLAFAACRDTSDSPTDAATDGGYPAPRTDAFQRLGSPDTLEIAAWNIENFPANGMTPSKVAELITSLDLDIVVCEEIASETAWKELVDRLREHDAVLSEHRYTPTEYQKIGVIYRTSMVTTSKVSLIGVESSYVFPRPPLSVQLAIDDGTHRALSLRIIGVHLKAGIAFEDGERRRMALTDLDTHVQSLVDTGEEDEVVIAGDYNEVLTTSVGQTNFAPLLSKPQLYTIRTKPNAEAGEITFVPSSVMLDHITTTAALDDDLAGAQLVIPRLQTIPGYVNEISDHLPVVLISPLQPR
jgi:hypothetical protein